MHTIFATVASREDNQEVRMLVCVTVDLIGELCVAVVEIATVTAVQIALSRQ